MAAVASLYRRTLPSPPAIEFASPEGKTGTGHFSPIGGYHAARDMVLILDVARFKYPPHWVPLSLLWTAMDTVDEATGQHRGFMLVSRLERASSILYTLSCRHESWGATAKYLSEEVPRLLSMTEVKTIEKLLDVLYTSALSDLRDFINWIAEVRSQDDQSEVVSQEERDRLRIKAKVLQQVNATALYGHITKWLSSKSCCKNVLPSAKEDSIGEVASKVCHEGAQLLCGKYVSSSGSCCRVTEMRLSKDGVDEQLTMISGHGVDVLVPCCQENEDSCRCSPCPSPLSGRHPSTFDILAVLFLALPPNTWSGIRDEKLREEICDIVSTEKLPPLLQEEVLHIRGQLHFLSTET